MAGDVHSLIAYNHALWRRFADFYVDKCTWEELSTQHGTSHETIANVTMHAINMEDWWLHYVMQNVPWNGPAWDGFTDANSMRQRIQEVEEKTVKLVGSMGPDELRRQRAVNVDGISGEMTIEEVLGEVVSEGFHHRGEVMAMLWRIDKEPPYVGYLEHIRGGRTQVSEE